MVFCVFIKKQQSLPIHSNNLTFVLLFFMLRYKKIYVPIYANWRFPMQKFGEFLKNFVNQEGYD